MALASKVQSLGMEAKPEVGIQFGAGGASRVEGLESEGTFDVSRAIDLARRRLDAGARLVMIESERITENIRSWRTDVVARLAAEFGLEPLVFEAADPEVFGWYVKAFGHEVNLFVDHSQVVQLEAL